MPPRLLRAVALTVVLALVPLAAIRAASADEPPLLLAADRLTYDSALDVVTAVGHVEIEHGGRILRAERVSYDVRRDIVRAEGNVAVLEPSGEVAFADQVELSDKLRQGFITGIRILLTDNSRIAATGAQRFADERTILGKAVYSACAVCRDDPTPLWQIKAVRVIHDKAHQRIDYEDAFLEFFGVPVAYTPYFSHPDPTVKRKSGFLAPSYGSSSQLGLRFELPYYFALAPHRDATLTPVLTSREGPVLLGEYRERFRAGLLEARGSITRPGRRDANNAEVSGHDTRGHIDAFGRFDFDERWRWGFDAQRTTDDTYLRRYDISNAQTLQSRLFLEGFDDRSYSLVDAFAFQGLREQDDPGDTPVIAPEVSHHLVGEPDAWGGRLDVAANLLVIERTESTDSRRISLGGTWRLPFVAPLGDVYALTASVRGDGYFVDEVRTSADPTVDAEDGFAGRLAPRLALDWRFPFIREWRGIRQVVEPIASFVLAPYGGNPDRIPNEDSLAFEFDDTNLFEHDRFPGLDRVEGGPRLTYGVRLGAYTAAGANANAMFGQTLRRRADSTFADKTGLEDKRSDFVGRISIAPNEYFDLINRFRLDRDTLVVRRNEVRLSAGPPSLRLDLGYVVLDRELTADGLVSREELLAVGRAQLARFWWGQASTRQDLGEQGGTLHYGVGVGYEDECFIFSTELVRRFTEDRDLKPSTSLVIRARLKNLG